MNATYFIVMALQRRTPSSAPHERRLEQFIERMGMLSEEDGLPRIAGRIFGLLLLTPGDLSLDAMAERLGVSKASVSNDARRLESQGLLERRTRPGDRRDYYAISPDAFARSIEARLERMRRFYEALESARDLTGGSSEVERRLSELDAAYEMSVRMMRQVLDEARRASALRMGR